MAGDAEVERGTNRCEETAHGARRSASAGVEPSFEDQRRRQLVSAVVVCMSEEGFEQTTMRNIAERAGVSIGMLNYYLQEQARASRGRSLISTRERRRFARARLGGFSNT